jgi:hypothetical protein
MRWPASTVKSRPLLLVGGRIKLSGSNQTRFNPSEIAEVLIGNIGEKPVGQWRKPLVDGSDKDGFPRYAAKTGVFQCIPSFSEHWFCHVCKIYHGARFPKHTWPESESHLSIEYTKSEGAGYRAMRPIPVTVFNKPSFQSNFDRGLLIQASALLHLGEKPLRDSRGFYGSRDGFDVVKGDAIWPAFDTAYRAAIHPPSDSFRQFANSYEGQGAFCLWTPHPLLDADDEFCFLIRRCDRCNKSLSNCECPPKYAVGCPYCGLPIRRLKGKPYCAASVRTITASVGAKVAELTVPTREKREGVDTHVLVINGKILKGLFAGPYTYDAREIPFQSFWSEKPGVIQPFVPIGEIDSKYKSPANVTFTADNPSAKFWWEKTWTDGAERQIRLGPCLQPWRNQVRYVGDESDELVSPPVPLRADGTPHMVRTKDLKFKFCSCSVCREIRLIEESKLPLPIISPVTLVDSQAAVAAGFPVTRLRSKRTRTHKMFPYQWWVPGSGEIFPDAEDASEDAIEEPVALTDELEPEATLQEAQATRHRREERNNPKWERKLAAKKLGMNAGTSDRLPPANAPLAGLLKELQEHDGFPTDAYILCGEQGDSLNLDNLARRIIAPVTLGLGAGVARVLLPPTWRWYNDDHGCR